MIKRLKLIFYITSAVILGLATIWQIYSVRQALILTNGKQLDAELSQVKAVVELWEKRQPFNSESVEKSATPSSKNTPTVTEEQPASPSAKKITPSPTPLN